jgi:hypothetical protein
MAKSTVHQRPVQRLAQFGAGGNRSGRCLVVGVIMEHLEREET